jgi:nicotinate phosphoribosyltransferase
MIASKAARVTMACRGRPYVDFSARRDHGLDAALGVARASYVAGAAGTSLVEGGRRFGIPVSGTMAHSYVMAHRDEVAAFRAFLRRFGAASVLLVDTYDTADGTRRAIDAMEAEGVEARGIRIDSGDLAALAAQARSILDDAGHPGVEILVSGDLDEDQIAEMIAADAPVDAFGVGTRLGTSSDAPYLGMVYKLAEQGGEPRIKLSPGKETWPGRKQLWRSRGVDVMALAGEDGPPGSRPLLAPVVIGEPAAPKTSIREARQRCADSLAAWDGAAPDVRTSSLLGALTQQAAAVLAPR